MGFGILFLACFFTFLGVLTPLSAFTYVIGFAIMLYALYKLSSQNKWFTASCILSLVLLLISLVIVIMYVFGAVEGALYTFLIRLQTNLTPIIAIFILVAISVIAKEVDLKKIQARAIVNIVFLIIYFVCDTLSIVIKSEEAIKRIGLVGVISQIIYTLLILINVFNCYMRICYEDDKDMSNSSSGIPAFDFLNKMLNKAMDKNRKNKPDNKGDE